MVFNNHKYEESALLLLMIKLQQDLINDNKKTFEEGVKFGWLGTEILTIYRYKKAQKYKQERLTAGQKEILNRGLQIIKELNIPKEWFDDTWLSENCFRILKEFETKKEEELH